jgi:hypothetical protein
MTDPEHLFGPTDESPYRFCRAWRQAERLFDDAVQAQEALKALPKFEYAPQ